MNYFFSLLFCLLTFISFLQTDEGAGFDFNKKPKPLDKTNSKNITLYYGLPHLEKAWQTNLFKSLAMGNQNIQEIRSSGIGLFGVRGEYFVSNIIALGFDVMYNRYRIDFKDVYQVYDPSYTYLIEIFDQYSYIMERIRIQFRANFHFNVSNPHIDLYGGVGLGLNYRNKSFKKNGETTTNTFFETTNLVIPISSRICFGYRQTIKNNFAISFETGLGGPLFSMGLSYNL